MNWRLGILVCALLLASGGRASGGAGDGSYLPSPDQQRVDRSFSNIRIETPLDQVRSRLTEIPVDRCEEWGECEWRDTEGVRYFLWADEPFAYFVVVKAIQAVEFEGRQIPALGIGLARERGRVLEEARSFIPAADFECQKSEQETESCTATLDPGSVSIRFDAAGKLTDVQLDGYHYT